MVNITHLLLFLLLSSCALFKSDSSLNDSTMDQILDSIKVLGEGRGRLGIDKQSYLFSYEALLNEHTDWVLAVAVPLHGEEVMILHDMREKTIETSTQESFEARIENEVRQRRELKGLKGDEFVREIRSFIRFILAKKLSLKRVCRDQECELEGEKFAVQYTKERVYIRKNISSTFVFELNAENLTEGHFGRTNFLLRPRVDGNLSSSVMSLELFWK